MVSFATLALSEFQGTTEEAGTLVRACLAVGHADLDFSASERSVMPSAESFCVPNPATSSAELIAAAATSADDVLRSCEEHVLATYGWTALNKELARRARPIAARRRRSSRGWRAPLVSIGAPRRQMGACGPHELRWHRL